VVSKRECAASVGLADYDVLMACPSLLSKLRLEISRLVKGVRVAELSGECRIDESGEGMVRASGRQG